MGVIANPALAQGEDLERAVTAFHSGEFRQSLKLLQRLAPSVKDPKEVGRLHLYLGLNYAFLDQRAKARGEFIKALSHNPELELNPERIRPDVVKLFRNVRASMKGTLEFASGPARATVRVDGVVQGRVPLTLPVAVGRHHVEVRDTLGRSLFRGWVVVLFGRTTPVAVKVTPTARVSQPPDNPPPRPVPPGPPPKDDPPGQPGGRLWTWVAAGGAAVFAGIGLGLVLSARSDYDEYQVTEDRDRFFELEDAIPRKYVASYVMFGVGGALAVTAGVLYFYEGRVTESRGAGVRLRIDAAGVGFDF